LWQGGNFLPRKRALLCGISFRVASTTHLRMAAHTRMDPHAHTRAPSTTFPHTPVLTDFIHSDAVAGTGAFGCSYLNSFVAIPYLHPPERAPYFRRCRAPASSGFFSVRDNMAFYSKQHNDCDTRRVASIYHILHCTAAHLTCMLFFLHTTAACRAPTFSIRRRAEGRQGRGRWEGGQGGRTLAGGAGGGHGRRYDSGLSSSLNILVLVNMVGAYQSVRFMPFKQT